MKPSFSRTAGVLSVTLALTALLGLAQSPHTAAGLPETADPARLYESVRLLSTWPDGSPRTRFAFQTDMDSIGLALEDQLALALAPAGERASTERSPFEAEPDTCKSCPVCPTWDVSHPYRTTFYNIVGRLRGKSTGQGKFLITAHYDAIGCRTSNWRPETGPAPGADDNATGSAAVLELARILSRDPQYEFDMDFILFDGEEEILLGSKALAEDYKNRGEVILGVLNMDMIGYNPRVDSLVVMTNRSSNFLAEYMIESEAADPQPDFTFTREIANIGYSDHAPFWDRGYPAILVIENVRIVNHNPQYHKVTDTPATISRQGVMMAKGANVILKTLRRLAAGASEPPNLRLSDDDILVSVNRAGQPPAYAAPGDTVRVQVGAFNLGGNFGPLDEQTIRLYRVRDEGRELLHEEVVHGPLLNGGHASIVYTFFPTAADAGAITLEAETGEGASRNVARRAIPVRVNGVRVVTHYVAPNPVHDLTRATFNYELSHEATVHVTFFDMHGDPVGDWTFPLGVKDEPGSGVEPGLNRMPLSTFFYDDDVPPGIYLYRMEISVAGEAMGSETGKFAVVR
jgi:hypothetical protein